MHYGIYQLLTVLPIWATALAMFTATMGVLFVLRDKCEGLYYQTSYSAQLGDGGLIVILLMAAEILKRGDPIPKWTETLTFQVVAIGISMILGIVWFTTDRPKQWADRYHHLVIAPLLCYLGLTLFVQVIWLNGTRLEFISASFLIALWAALSRYDAVTSRLKQRDYHDLDWHLKWMQWQGKPTQSANVVNRQS